MLWHAAGQAYGDGGHGDQAERSGAGDRARFVIRPLDAATHRTVYHVFVRHQVLAFRDQRLTPDQQVAFANFDAARHPRVLHRTCLRGAAPA